MWEQRARHCPICAAVLEKKQVEERERSWCPGCGLILYLNPAAAAAAVVLRGSDVLLIRRVSAPYRDHWTLPAGYEEYDEPPMRTAVRETKEETGLDVRVTGLLDVLYTEDDPRKRGILVVYLCEVVGGEIRPGDDAAEARFFPIDRLPDQVGFRNNRRVLARVRSDLHAGSVRTLPIEPDNDSGA